MKEITNDPGLVAFCGLYCGACGKYLKGSCLGCKENEKAVWCKIRTCCIDANYANCSECQDYENVLECKKFNNFMAKVFAVIFKSDRPACISRIKEIGLDVFATEMSDKGLQSIKK